MAAAKFFIEMRVGSLPLKDARLRPRSLPCAGAFLWEHEGLTGTEGYAVYRHL